MITWTIRFTDRTEPLVVPEVPTVAKEKRDSNEGDQYVACERDMVEVWYPKWVVGEVKRVYYPWHRIASIERAGESE